MVFKCIKIGNGFILLILKNDPKSNLSSRNFRALYIWLTAVYLIFAGWWFDACGPSNLNGVYYQQGQNTNRFNGIKWYYWKGSGYSLKATTIMIRPADFWWTNGVSEAVKLSNPIMEPCVEEEMLDIYPHVQQQKRSFVKMKALRPTNLQM